jgi:hypothetical protein
MNDDKWADNRLYSGFVWGMFIGSLVAMFRIPHLNLHARLKRIQRPITEENQVTSRSP